MNPPLCRNTTGWVISTGNMPRTVRTAPTTTGRQFWPSSEGAAGKQVLDAACGPGFTHSS